MKVLLQGCQMRYLVRIVATIALLASGSAANALVVGSVEWRPLIETINISRASALGACPAVSGFSCAGSVNGGTIDLSGWTWASINEVTALFSELIPDYSANATAIVVNPSVTQRLYSEANSAAIAGAVTSFGITFSVGGGAPYRGTAGYTNQATSPSGTNAYAGTLRDWVNAGTVNKDRADVGVDAIGTGANSAYGLWLYRPATPVPLPAAAWLLISGVGGLLAFARRRRSAVA